MLLFVWKGGTCCLLLLTLRKKQAKMKNTPFIKIACNLICLLAVFGIGAAPDVSPPEATITNGLIKAHLYLPDADNGYYRATRFDWSGVMNSLEFDGHNYYGQWYERYSPTINDAIMGPVEAFDPLGYDDAQPGGSFVKVGVGELTKPNTTAYNFATYYPIVNSGKWKIKVKPDQVQFTHTLKGAQYAYEYNKTVKLLKDKPVMVLSHTLKNTGDKTITTAVFDHNFLVIDKQLTGPGFEVNFPIADEKLNPRMEEFVKLQDKQLVFLKELGRRNASFKDLTNGVETDYSIKVDNHNTGAGVKITADRPISKLVFWSAAKTICPEPYINITIAPGKTFSWNITYEYYSNPVNSLAGSK
jgi:hypothetical protein